MKIDIKSLQNAVIEIDNIVTFVISAALHKPQRFYVLIRSKHPQSQPVCTACIPISNTHYLTLKPCLLFGNNGIAMHLENISKWASTWWTIIVLNKYFFYWKFLLEICWKFVGNFLTKVLEVIRTMRVPAKRWMTKLNYA